MQSRLDRAKQFLPFDALKGFREVLEEVKKEDINKIDLLEDLEEIINQKLLKLKVGDKIVIKHYYNTFYIESIGNVIKIDKVNRYIYLDNSKISFDDIINIDLI